MVNAEEILYSIALRRSPLVGDVIFASLVSEVGSAKEAWGLSKLELRKISGVGKQIASNIGDKNLLKFAEKEIEFCIKNEIKIHLRHLNQLPRLLGECYDAPAILFQKGDYEDTANNISIVGTRNATAYGKSFLEDLIVQFKNKNIQVISGLALGTDGIAHQEALKNNIKTSAVLAHGLHIIYPSKHKILAEEILNNGGALFSEFCSDEKPDREHFLQRNRIVAGLSANTIVVESAYAGGSISTASFANQYNREVYALAGRLTDKYSQGCNHLIFQNKAKIISSIKGLLKDLDLDNTSKVLELFPSVEVSLTPVQEPVYDIIKEVNDISLDDLSEKLNQPISKVFPVLLELELLGLIRANSGRRYSII
ncbi:DNA-processing protein DprA [Riemerella anatipestifer]|uniref:DNA protecting protein dpra n=1 Tax=Riemerella anatipestifer (strain ATCC 11845 / DSM 15868 / JCM 9532 / NCTC 11014) TaxID=693978 RepID=E4TBU2_RIEAD|nr:DNA-processing protein DprA [Riemerella anatipestifer]ADQ81989.1 DNA protecting protein DprA [Riemerella anatipestifer ATCC 11845 = DSM 15868]ADZ12511.1 Predicted Rossmann fold nucleotide-binding protein involved in DNA uptake [Riemerella anatipestifer RA-GD]AFD55993.1 DNA protecting protein dpra [Riemerella anatipestifer ATCC 11845 = DSM 15868]AGC40098.1 putative Rossmann fold nucleotide-binding protein involved in DNA uptake [Riemerella anatipestifer RA-CH-2]AKP71098.1 DNA protecting prot